MSSFTSNPGNNPTTQSAGPGFGSKRGKDRSRNQTFDLSKLFDQAPPAAVEHEMCLLGSMLLDERAIGEAIEILDGADDFYKPAHGVIYNLLVTMYNNGEPLELVNINQRLREQGQLDDIGGTRYLVELGEQVPSPASAPYYAEQVKNAALKRELINSAADILHKAYRSPENIDEQLNHAQGEIFKLAKDRKSNKARKLHDLLQETYDRLEASEGKFLTGMDTGFTDLNDFTSGLQAGEMIIVAARPSMGKAQPLDAKVLTVDGWTTMGQLQVGDPLASVDGKPSKVKDIFPQGTRQAYRVTFSDGRSTECCQEHLWRVMYREWDEPRVLDTAKLMKMLASKRYQRRLWIETFNGEFGKDHDLPFDGWVLGCLLGDGTLSGTTPRISSADPELIEALSQALGNEISLNPAGGYDYRISQTKGATRAGIKGTVPNPVRQSLELLGLWGSSATTKFIPEIYKQASYEARAALLAGLIDTDGWVEKFGALRFATSSLQLARDVVDLMRSLGGTASYTRKQTTYTYEGVKRQGLPTYVCNLQHEDATQFVRLKRKSIRLAAGRSRQRRLNIVSIEPTRQVEMQCIAVTHPSHLYITDDYIVTHNTAFALNMAEHMAANNSKAVAFFSLEMSAQQLAQRLLCSRSGVDSHKLRRNMLSPDDFEVLAKAVGQLADAPLYIDDTPGLDMLMINSKARRLAQEHEIEAIFIDYLQLMSYPGAESRQQEVSNISRSIKALARELEVPVICLSQLNRGPESREGHRPRMSDLRESGSIEQDADVVLMLHREEYYHNDPRWKEENPEKVGVAEIILAKQRNGPTGTIEMAFDGNTTRFRDLSRRRDV